MTPTYQEIGRGTQEVVKRLLEDVGSDANRWVDLIDVLDDLAEPEFQQVVRQLEEIDPSIYGAEEKRSMEEKLRALVSRHTEFTDADWALPIEQVRHLRSILSKYEPDDPLTRVAWLFKENPDFPEEDAKGWEARDEAIRVARIAAVEALLTDGGLQRVLSLAPTVERPWHIGVALGQSSQEVDDQDFLSKHLHAADPQLDEMVKGYVYSRVATRGGTWALRLLGSDVSKDWPAEQRGELCTSLPFEKSSWDVVDKEEPDVQQHYWMNVQIYVRGGLDAEIVEGALRQFLRYGRLGTAIDFAAMYRAVAKPETIGEVLIAVKGETSEEEINWSRLSHDVGELLGVLRQSDVMNEEDLVSLEWYFLPLLGRGGHLPEVLYKKLAEDPAFFIQVLSFVYRPEDASEQREPTEAEKGRAEVAWRLLHEWSRPPGLKDDQTVDANAVKNWVRWARELADTSKLSEITDVNIGEILSVLPAGTDDLWPHESVREVLEELDNSRIENGLYVGRLNSRGITSRSIGEGGVQERDLVSQYKRYFEGLRDRWPRAAKVVEDIVEHYEADARREDVRAEFDRERWG